MYNYMVLNVSDRVYFKDFMSYYKRSECDDYYFVAVNHPKMIQYLEEFLVRRTN
ncbi:MAG: hypothetical protein OEU95_05085 [Nitrospirota bacterium]|nr:hypothetical protein [Nitrospirota bacterium]